MRRRFTECLPRYPLLLPPKSLKPARCFENKLIKKRGGGLRSTGIKRAEEWRITEASFSSVQAILGRQI